MHGTRAIILFLSVLFMGSYPIKLWAAHHHVVIFIHGTVQAGLTLLTPRPAWNDSFDGSTWFERALNLSRTHGFAEKSDLMLKLGLTEVTHLINASEIDPLYCHKAAIHIIRAFDQMTRAYQAENSAVRHYYTFGWHGLISEKHREKSASLLYDALIKIKGDLLQKADDSLSIELHGHSHGGQLILHLAHIKKERRDKDFVIDLAVLSASPLYYQKAKHVFSGTFKIILNVHSDGDRIQTVDFVSTPERRCYRRFKEIGMPLPSDNSKGPLIADVRLLTHQQHNVFGHACFFILDRYYLPSYLRNRKKIRAAINHFDPLPLIALYPVLVSELIKQAQETGLHGYQNFDINILKRGENLTADITHHDKKRRMSHVRTIAFPDSLAASKQEVCTAYANTRFITEFDKAAMGLKHAIKTAGKKGRRLYAYSNDEAKNPLTYANPLRSS
jgi:hypothetical protein